MNSPEEKEDCEKVVRVPKSFKVLSTGLFNGCEDHGHEGEQHDISTPSWTSRKIGEQETRKAEIVLRRQLSEVIPVRNCMDPRKQHDGPSHQFVKCDVLVELNYSIQWRLSEKRDECSADGEQNQGDVEV